MSIPAVFDVGAMRERVRSVDLVRGPGTFIMALDHAREFLSSVHFDPTDLTRQTYFHTKRRCAMSEKDIQKDDLVGQTKAIRDHDHDMVHDLSKRLDAVWRYDQYIENADKFPEVQRFWQESKQTELKTIERLKELIREHVRKDNF